jgi:hypothetical protein
LGLLVYGVVLMLTQSLAGLVLNSAHSGFVAAMAIVSIALGTLVGWSLVRTLRPRMRRMSGESHPSLPPTP